MNQYDIKIGLKDKALKDDVGLKALKELTESFINNIMKNMMGSTPDINFKLGQAPDIQVKEVSFSHVVLSASMNEYAYQWFKLEIPKICDVIYETASELREVYDKYNR